MFYSLYSSDFEYREAVHHEILEVLNPTLQEHLQGYKVVVNTFVVKASGPESEFYVHQDTTALDEMNHTAISWWIPLQDTDTTNGALSVVEKSHWLLPPYRGVSFPFAFNKIVPTVRDYLKPLVMKPGEVLIFDARVIHNSWPNHSGKDRIAIVCGIFPKEAEFITCWKDSKKPNSPIEFYRHDDNYTLKYPNFFYNCHDRPVSGEKIKEEAYDFPDMTSDEFEYLCQVNNISKLNQLGEPSASACNMIAEPDGINREPVDLTVEKNKTILSKTVDFISGLLGKNS